MNANTYLALIVVFFAHAVICRDFYVGMFKKNDILVASDNLYKERVPFRAQRAKYGRVFKCPITYFRVVDRLGMGRGPKVQIIRGGLRHKYIVLRLTSPYNFPISVNIYIGCENKMTTTRTTTKTKSTTLSDSKGNSTTVEGNNSTTTRTDGEKGTTLGEGNLTTAEGNNSTTTRTDGEKGTTLGADDTSVTEYDRTSTTDVVEEESATTKAAQEE